jgi:hypothetical protein
MRSSPRVFRIGCRLCMRRVSWAKASCTARSSTWICNMAVSGGGLGCTLLGDARRGALRASRRSSRSGFSPTVGLKPDRRGLGAALALSPDWHPGYVAWLGIVPRRSLPPCCSGPMSRIRNTVLPASSIKATRNSIRLSVSNMTG